MNRCVKCGRKLISLTGSNFCNCPSSYVDTKTHTTYSKLVIDDSDEEKYGEFDYHCPSCKKMLGSESYDECLYFRYCPNCGVKLVRENTNEE